MNLKFSNTDVPIIVPINQRQESLKSSGIVSGKTSVNRRKSVGKTSGKIISAIRENEKITIPELATIIGITEPSIERNIRKLQNEGSLRRIGPAKGDHWEVLK